MRYLLGIDIGTTGTKVLLVDERGEVIAGVVNTYPLSSPHPDWMEQDPAYWWQAAREGTRQVISASSVNPREIAGVGLTGQYHGAVLVDNRGQALRPCILWCDQRTAQQSEGIREIVGREKLLEITGSAGFPYFTACKILWVRENEPSVYEKLYKLLLPKDYVRFKLTGTFVTDVTDASGTLLLDSRRRKWSGEMLQYLQLIPDILPECLESADVSGYVTEQAAQMTGLAKGIPVIAGAGDQAAQAVGNGIIEEGLIICTLGTSGVIFASTDTLCQDPQGRVDSFCHAVPGKWHVMGVVQSAGGSLRWFRDSLCQYESEQAGRTGKDVYQILAQMAGQVGIGSEDLIFLPYLNGERHPYCDPLARGVFFGLSLRHTKSHLIRSVMEGVAYGLRDSLEVMKELELPIREVRLSGGGSRSQLWRQILSGVNNTDIVTMNSTEGAAFGAAILAGVGSGIYKDIQEACSEMVRPIDAIHPENKAVALYNAYYGIYRSLYPLLKRKFLELSRVTHPGAVK